MNKRLLIFMLFILVQMPLIRAQMTQSTTDRSSGTVSQNASADRIDDVYSPDLFTGTVNVHIPIYSYSVDGVSASVSLSYNTGGIRVDEVASMTGLGWNLNAGGVITRETVGVEDEVTYPNIDTTSTTGVTNPAVGIVGGRWAWNTSTDAPDMFTAVIGDRSFKFYVNEYAAGQYKVHTIPAMNVVVDVIIDHKSLAGFTGGFAPNTMERFTTFPELILRFRITDEHGNQFFFDRGDVQIKKYTYNAFNSIAGFTSPTTSTYRIPLSWVLSKIRTYAGAEISYNYTTDFYDYHGYMDQRVRESQEYFAPYWAHNIPGSIGAINEPVALKIHKRRLTSINYPNGDVVSFNTDGNSRLDVTGAVAITEIKVEKGYDATVKNSISYKFNYAYSNADAWHGVEQSYPTPSVSISDPDKFLRLRLKSIDKVGTDNTTTEKYYKFDYLDAVRLPARLSGLTDCYGYFNGKPYGSVAIIPTSTLPMYTDLQAKLTNINIPIHPPFTFTDVLGVFRIVTYGRDMASDANYAKAGLLSSITNGLGGNVNFAYKSHNLGNVSDFNTTPVYSGYYDFDNVQLYNAPGHYGPPSELQLPLENDGVCIDYITTNDGYNVDNNTKTEFTLSNGLRFYTGGYFWYPNFTQGYAGGPTPSSIAIYDKIYQNTFVTPMESVNGCNHGYSNATVNTYGASMELIKTNTYSFTNLLPQAGEEQDGVDMAGSGPRIQLYYGPYTHTLHRRYFNSQYLGLMKSSATLDNLGNKISETINTYNEINHADTNMIDEGFSYIGEHNSPSLKYGAGDPYLWTSEYRYYNSIVKLKRSVTTDYSGLNSISITKEYEYDAQYDLSLTKYHNSKGEEVIEQPQYDGKSYTIDYKWPSTMTKIHLAKWLVGNLTTVNSKIVSYSRLKASYSLNTLLYDGVGNQISTTFGGGIWLLNAPLETVRFDQLHVLFANTPVTTVTSNTVTAKEFTVYDDHSNVLETGYNNSQNFASAIWDTRIGQKVAAADHAQYKDIAYSSFEGSYTATVTPDYNKGNWDFDPTNIVLGTTGSKAMTGRYYYDLTGMNITSLYPPQNLKRYMVSVWYKGVLPSISPSLGPFVDQLTVGAWKLATVYVVGNGTTSIMISSSGTTYIDELRMHPEESGMNTYTYEPLIGISSHCNERNNITYFEYDAMGRPKITRDINGNIISLTKSVVQGNDH